MLLTLALAAFAGSTPVKATATTVPGLTGPQLSPTTEVAWATFPTTISGKTVTATVKCKNGGACSVYDGIKKIGTATIIKIQTGGFILNSSLSTGGTSWVVEATWTPVSTIANEVKVMEAIPAQ